jgi:hypothetical protein
MNRYILRLSFLLFAVLPMACQTAPFGTAINKASPQTNQSFFVATYLNGHSHPQNLALPRLFADLARHGITRVVLLPFQYDQFAPQGLHEIAKSWNIELIYGLNDLSHLAPDQQERDFKALLEHVKSRPGSDAITGWYLCDEIELGCGPEIEEPLRKFAEMVRRLDPSRTTIVNHHSQNKRWEGRFGRTGEDEAWCSVFFASHHARRFLEGKIAGLREAAGGKPVVLVYGAQAAGFVSESDLKTYGNQDITLQDYNRMTPRQAITDYVTTARAVGAAGVALFAYDAYYDYTWYTLVDERGRSVQEKMEGLLDGVTEVRRQQGWPELQLEVSPKPRSLTIAVKTKAGTQLVKEVQVEASFDSGYSWTPVNGFAPAGGTVDFSIPFGWQRPGWTMIRARCFDGRQHSLWSVWNVFPWAKPNAS